MSGRALGEVAGAAGGDEVADVVGAAEGDGEDVVDGEQDAASLPAAKDAPEAVAGVDVAAERGRNRLAAGCRPSSSSPEATPGEEEDRDNGGGDEERPVVVRT